MPPSLRAGPGVGVRLVPVAGFERVLASGFGCALQCAFAPLLTVIVPFAVAKLPAWSVAVSVTV
jgi:hypothetical protein